jgi:hypothetical protein
MLHPDIVVKNSKISGKGLFAKRFIPKGTIVWILKGTKIYTKKDYKKFKPRYRSYIDRYAYQDEKENYVLAGDRAMYWNHSCNPNTGGYMKDDKDVALRDIKKGEEVTQDYGLLMTQNEKPIECHCGSLICRGTIIRKKKSSKIIKDLYRKIREGFRYSNKVKQPMKKYLK